MLKHFLSTIIISLTFSFVLQAKDLTNQEIENWLSASPEISTWLNKHKAILNSEEKINFLESSPKQVSDYANRVLKKHDLYAPLKANLNQYGFSNLDRFFEVQTQIVQAYMAVSVEQANIPSSMNQELLNALADLEKAEGLTAEQKAQMKKQMTQMMGQVMKMQGSPKNQNDREKITPYLDKISAAFEQFQ
ncbi:hypothetical protein [Catenovulum adriaticum]|uniref:DUF2059 domain-containing protein n=1 Tax=Catenovulum adriaticum TaxID=2984846 RepID=A0ABY7AP28_9ALTE|nr:hypothetical protein [Catenovulum sp. TS8]WAJ70031.1 hypothetical protein OLW01_12920 [Catenovulum sp. TS8]